MSVRTAIIILIILTIISGGFLYALYLYNHKSFTDKNYTQQSSKIKNVSTSSISDLSEEKKIEMTEAMDELNKQFPSNLADPKFNEAKKIQMMKALEELNKK